MANQMFNFYNVNLISVESALWEGSLSFCRSVFTHLQLSLTIMNGPRVRKHKSELSTFFKTTHAGRIAYLKENVASLFFFLLPCSVSQKKKNLWFIFPPMGCLCEKTLLR